MTIMISARHGSVTDDIKGYAQAKLEGVLEGRHKISSADIILDLQKNRHIAEIVVRGKHLNIEADSESYDMHESIDIVIGKIDRQISKYFDKKQDHHNVDTASVAESIEKLDKNTVEDEYLDEN